MAPELRLLGGFTLVCEDGAVSVPERGQVVLAHLALRRTGMSRAELAGNVWCDVGDARALANLRAALFRLPPSAAALVLTEGRSLRLADGVRCDADELHRTFWQLAGGAPVSLDDLRAAVTALVGPLADELLPCWYDDVILHAREQLRELRIQALELAAAAALSAGWTAGATAAALAAVAAEPLRERPHLLLVRAHLAAGDRVAARRVYDSYRVQLERALGFAPAVPFEALDASALVLTTKGELRETR